MAAGAIVFLRHGRRGAGPSPSDERLNKTHSGGVQRVTLIFLPHCQKVLALLREDLIGRRERDRLPQKGNMAFFQEVFRIGAAFCGLVIFGGV